MAQENFYNYVNQEWLNENEIPKGYSRWSRFNELADKTLFQLKDLLLNIEDERINKLKNLFENYNLKNEKTFIMKLLKEIDATNNISDLLNLYQNKLSLFGVQYLYGLNIENDMKNSKYNVLYVSPLGLTLPGKDYYIKDEFKDKREKYLEFLIKFSEFYNLNLNANDILSLETSLAKLHLAPEDKRNPNNIYFPTSYQKMTKQYFIPLDIYFKLIGKDSNNLKEEDKIICTNEKYFKDYLNNQSFNLLKSYLKFKTALKFSFSSQGLLYELIFDFFYKTLSGQKEHLILWKRTINLFNVTLGELLGKEYIKKYFSNKAKTYVSEMIFYFKTILHEMIKKNNWMEQTTKEKALQKLETINWKIGFPNKWIDFSSLSLGNLTSLSECLAKINEWWFYYNSKDLYEMVDLEKWEMLPHEVNAYYNPLLNEIVFPAAILQPPFFSLDFTLPQNYGGIGVVIAHEITHGFDDEGKDFDSEGNLNNWWTEKDLNKFNEEACKLETQFNNFELYDTKLNGKLTLGENLADLGGVKISLAALTKKINNINLNQIKEFFESFAKIWANLCMKEEGQKLIKTDPHSPGEFRVNGILPHLDEFHQVYQISAKNKMFLKEENRCKIWTL